MGILSLSCPSAYAEIRRRLASVAIAQLKEPFSFPFLHLKAEGGEGVFLGSEGNSGGLYKACLHRLFGGAGKSNITFDQK